MVTVATDLRVGRSSSCKYIIYRPILFGGNTGKLFLTSCFVSRIAAANIKSINHDPAAGLTSVYEMTIYRAEVAFKRL